VRSIFSQFEYQQAQLEAEIENLSWKIEHAETTDRGDLENQMDIAEKRRYGGFCRVVDPGCLSRICKFYTVLRIRIRDPKPF
jgi:hypothetical protein